MSVTKMILGALAVVVVALLAYVRLAPSDPARWHQPVTSKTSEDFSAGAVRVVEGGAEAFERLAETMAALPRTTVLAGSAEEGRVTYVTRSKVFGFPDYTTIEADNGQIRAFGRLRFGASDVGVNAARLDRVIATAGLG